MRLPSLPARLLGSLLLAALLMASAQGAQRRVPPFKITAVKAMLFYGQTGTFSPDLFTSAGPVLQNVSTGEGQASATLVVVEVSGPPGRYAADRRVVFSARAAGRALLAKTLPVGRTGDDGKFYVAFWLYETGCAPVSLSARMAGEPASAAVRKTIDFKCGD